MPRRGRRSGGWCRPGGPSRPEARPGRRRPPGDAGGGPARQAEAGRGQVPDLEPPFPETAGGPPGNLFGPVDEPEPAPRRVYAWNPSDTTEALPRIRPDDAQPN